MLKYSSNFFSFAKWMPHSAQFSKMKCIKVSFPQFNHYPSWIPKNSLIRKNPTSLETTNWSTTTDWSNDIKQGQLVKNPTKQTANLVRQALTSHLWASVPHKVGLCVSSQVQHHKAGEAWSAKPRMGGRGQSKPHKSCSTCTCNCIAWLYSFSKLCSAEDFW